MGVPWSREQTNRDLEDNDQQSGFMSYDEEATVSGQQSLKRAVGVDSSGGVTIFTNCMVNPGSNNKATLTCTRQVAKTGDIP